MDLLGIATLLAALGCGLIAGVFFAFSTFVMQALARLPAAHGAAAMQAVNVTVLNPLFLGLLIGLAPLCIVLGVVAVLGWGEPGATLRLGGSVLYLVGTFAETRVVHVPMNDALAELDAESPEAAEPWRRYLARWTAWNHVRTVAALAAALAFTLALIA